MSNVNIRLAALCVVVCVLREVLAARPGLRRAFQAAVLDRAHALGSVAVMAEVCRALEIE
jgi:hypothetical protein